MKNALFTKDGNWFLIPELPEKPDPEKLIVIQLIKHHEDVYQKALAEAIANALPVANPEIIESLPKFLNKHYLDVFIDVHSKDFYQWPGTFDTLESLPPKALLILPTASGSVAAPKEEEHIVIPESVRSEINAKGLKYAEDHIKIWALNSSDVNLVKHVFKSIHFEKIWPLESELAAAKESIKELLDIAERHVYMHGNDDSVTDRRQTIARAKTILGL